MDRGWLLDLGGWLLVNTLGKLLTRVHVRGISLMNFRHLTQGNLEALLATGGSRTCATTEVAIRYVPVLTALTQFRISRRQTKWLRRIQLVHSLEGILIHHNRKISKLAFEP